MEESLQQDSLNVLQNQTFGTEETEFSLHQFL